MFDHIELYILLRGTRPFIFSHTITPAVFLFGELVAYLLHLYEKLAFPTNYGLFEKCSHMDPKPAARLL